MRSRSLRIAIAVGAALVLGVGLAVARALRLPSRQLHVPPAPARAVDAEAAARHLAEAIRIQTISWSREAPPAAPAFAALHEWLAERYPLLHARLAPEPVAGQSLLYTWRGRRPELAPLVLLAHQDVVPAAGAERWSHPPFAGELADGFVWGRGAIDDKGPLVAICEAVEALLAAGFAPERTVLLAFGHDEELGGDEGAAKIAARLAARGVRAELVLDEGFALIEAGFLPDLPPLLAPVGIAEKGYATVELRARAAGGHSSTPPRHTAAGRVARAAARVEDHPMPARLGAVTDDFRTWLAPELPLSLRVPLANADWLLPVLTPSLSRQPAVDAMLRTTTAVTMLSGSPKANVLPVEATATVNFRILPGDSSQTVLTHVRSLVEDPTIEADFADPPREPSAVSPVAGPAFALLQRTIAESFPAAVVAPALVVGGTDARHYAAITPNLYRFVPFRFGPSDLERPHGVDERMAIDSLAAAVAFYERLIENASAPPR